MARTYAGILGLLAFLTCLIRGLIHGEGTESVLWFACCSLMIFAAVGGAIGGFARELVEGSVRQRLAAQLAANPATGAMPSAPSPTKSHAAQAAAGSPQ